MASSTLHILIWALGYCVLIALTQFGSITQEVINWDENTFMLLGSDLLDGTLPYIERFDNKPPMIFFIFAGWMGVFGETVPSVRLLGDLCLGLSALLIFATCRRFAPPFYAGLAGALFIVLHAVDPGLYTSAGLPAMVFVMAALWLLLSARQHVWAVVLAGVFISIAVLIRSNLAYLALASGAWLVIFGLIRPGGARFNIWSPFAYALGGLLPVLVLIGIYWQAGAVADLKLASFDVALSYSGQWGVAGALLENLRKWGLAVVASPAIYGGYTLVTLASLIAFFWPRRGTPESNMSGHDWAIVWIFLLSIQVSILKSGAIYTYYWQQFYPLTCLFIPVLLMRLEVRPILKGAVTGIIGLAVVSGLIRGGADSLRVMTSPGYVTENYDIQAAASILEDMMQPGDQVWALERHLILIYLDLPAISRVSAHPSNITRTAILQPLIDAGYVDANELDRIMASAPEFIVSHGADKLFYFRDDPDLIPTYIADHYDLVHATPIIHLYRRKP